MIIFGIVLVIVVVFGIIIRHHENELMSDDTPYSTGFSVSRQTPMNIVLVSEYIEACAIMSNITIHITTKNQFVVSGNMAGTKGNCYRFQRMIEQAS